MYQAGGREDKVLNVFKVVQFPNAACNTSTGTVSKVMGFFNFVTSTAHIHTFSQSSNLALFQP